MWLEETGLPWVKTSPNIYRAETAVHYPGTGYSIERHAGTTKLVKAFEERTLPALLDDWDRQARGFAEKSRPYWLYE